MSYAKSTSVFLARIQTPPSPVIESKTPMSALFEQRSRGPVPSNDEIMRHHDPDPDENPWVLGRPGFTQIVYCANDTRWPARYKALVNMTRSTLGTCYE